ncbi:hypothetical protein RB4284 [Rhodopirellula baltica SH 1]|uniref:Uncharacterized protein n=1 Tax=Rhodopirellula baltica (strain DSM 10527 / NCIMB 13988 / SH1) TaxID=243090 RepID=Q7USV1_RHOBA|nr:hypothetical protein RB4284 [Rhodopirellula baltica SH 1]
MIWHYSPRTPAATRLHCHSTQDSLLTIKMREAKVATEVDGNSMRTKSVVPLVARSDI